jgi:hypothetical protein
MDTDTRDRRQRAFNRQVKQIWMLAQMPWRLGDCSPTGSQSKRCCGQRSDGEW